MWDALLRCWVCDDAKGLEPLGLCERCDEELHKDATTPPRDNASVLPLGHLPEELPAVYVPAEKGWTE